MKRHVYKKEIAEQVKEMAGLGATQEQIAVNIDICKKTMVKHYWKEYEQGKARAEINIRKKLYDMAMNENNVACLLFICKTQYGMRETADLNINAKVDMSLSEVLTKAKERAAKMQAEIG